MRNFSKTLISMAAVMAVGSAMAAGAMAATLSATYSNGTVSIGNVTPGKDQYTLLIVQGEKAAGSTDYSYYAKNTTIKQIDQNDEGKAFTSTTVGTLDEGSYKVLVGNNDGSVDTGYFTVGGTDKPVVPPAVDPDPILVGDVDYSEEVDSSDALYIFQYEKNRGKQDQNEDSAKYTAFTADERELVEEIDGETTYFLGDVDYNFEVDSSDALYIFQYEKNRGKQDQNEASAKYTAFTADEIDVLPEEE